jgi:hypothetical protein
MPRPASGLAPGHAPPALAEPHLVPLAGEWALWRDIAVRTAGFPVSGLAIFGSPDEQAGLRAVACDPLFRTAVTWQNRAAMRNAVAKIAAGAAAPGSRQRQREEVVASYWQRYCAKNDTIVPGRAQAHLHRLRQPRPHPHLVPPAPPGRSRPPRPAGTVHRDAPWA